MTATVSARTAAKVCRECGTEVPRLAHNGKGICIACWKLWRKTPDFVSSHRPIAERLMNNVSKDESGCWLWTGVLINHGYGTLSINNRHHLAHRASYKAFVGPIPDGLVIDHLCRVRHCINPEHLEAVTMRENTMRSSSLSPSAVNARKTHCNRGHLYDDENTTVNARGHRKCRACNRAAMRRRSAS